MCHLKRHMRCHYAKTVLCHETDEIWIYSSIYLQIYWLPLLCLVKMNQLCSTVMLPAKFSTKGKFIWQSPFDRYVRLWNWHFSAELSIDSTLYGDKHSRNLTESQLDDHSQGTSPYDVPIEIVILLSIFYGAISLVAVLGKSRWTLVNITVRNVFQLWNFIRKQFGHHNSRDKPKNANSDQLFHCKSGIGWCGHWSFLNTVPVSGKVFIRIYPIKIFKYVIKNF